jgi:hypothetical protein
MTLQYLTDTSGKKISVVIPIGEYEQLLKHIEDLREIAERRYGERIALEEAKKQLIADQLLQE